MISPAAGEARWAATNTPARMVAGLTGLSAADAERAASTIAELNDTLRDSAHAWVDAVHSLRRLDPRPLRVPVAGFREL